MAWAFAFWRDLDFLPMTAGPVSLVQQLPEGLQGGDPILHSVPVTGEWTGDFRTMAFGGLLPMGTMRNIMERKGLPVLHWGPWACPWTMLLSFSPGHQWLLPLAF